jgi:dipeptidyl aminopeptidase/acylaminoacyl peptidase
LNVFVRDIAGGDERRLTSEEERGVAGFLWKGSDRVVFAMDKGGDENFHIFTADAAGGKIRELTPFDGVKASLVDELDEDPRHMLISLNKKNPEVFDVYRCDIETGELTMIADNPGGVVGWMTDHEGRLRVASSVDGVNTSILYRRDESEPFKTLLTTDFKEDFFPMMFSYDNRLLYVVSNLNRDKAAIYSFDPDKNEMGDLIYEHPEVDAAGILTSKKRKLLTGATYMTDRTRIHFFDEDSRALQEKLEAKLPGYEVIVTDTDDDERLFILLAHSDRQNGIYYLYDRRDDRLEKLAETMPWIKEEQMAGMTPVEYKSRDGLRIHGYLTLPEDAAPLGLPLVVIPHGGPSSRDVWGFSPEAQFLANRGAAVLSVNFRGSTGYGKSFWQAGFKQWGRKMQDDITDGVEWAIGRKIADKKRIAIYGASYGGYAALAGAVFTPDLYACAVDYVGVSNIFTMLESMPPYWKPAIEMEYEMVGDPVREKELLRAISPIFHIDRIKIPLFVAHGLNDPRVSKAESDQIVEAVRKAGHDVVYMVKDDEGHGFQNEENVFDFYRAMEEFFRKHLGLR